MLGKEELHFVEIWTSFYVLGLYWKQERVEFSWPDDVIFHN